MFRGKKIVQGEFFTNSQEDEKLFKEEFTIYRKGDSSYEKIKRGKLLISPKSNDEIGTIGIFFKKEPKSEKAKDIQYRFAFDLQTYKAIMKLL